MNATNKLTTNEFSSKEPGWLKPLGQKLRELLDLPPNWDSYGANAIARESVEFALKTVLPSTMLPNTPLPAVVPTARGGIQLEWHAKDIDLEVEIISPSRLYVYFEDSQSGLEWEKELTDDIAPLAAEVAKLTLHREYTTA